MRDAVIVNESQEWHIVGKHKQMVVYQHMDGSYAVERDFERLVEMSDADVDDWQHNGDVLWSKIM